MNALEKILEEIEEKIKLAEKVMVKPPCDKLDEIANDTAEAFIEAYKECKEIIRSHMDDVENDGWIPVSERLPEKAGTYIVSAKDGKRELIIILASVFDSFNILMLFFLGAALIIWSWS